MKCKPILIVPGDPNSVFFEIFFKSIEKNNYKSPLILISSLDLVKKEIKRFNVKKKIKLLDQISLNNVRIDNKKINLINVENNSFLNIKKNPNHTKKYINYCFKIAFRILRKKITNKLVNGPIDKSIFLSKKFLGITEFISEEFNQKKTAMLIYNKKISVCPVTTHLPLKLVSKKINKKLIEEKAILIDRFYKKNLNLKAKIGVTGLNPHCESILSFNEDHKIISPAIKSLRKKGYNVRGPYSADTIFLKKNRDKFNVIIGMYHDQVLAPIKTIFEYDAINLTLGLPFLRVSPDHGPNKKMINKNLSNPLSLTKSIKFLDNSD